MAAVFDLFYFKPISVIHPTELNLLVKDLVTGLMDLVELAEDMFEQKEESIGDLVLVEVVEISQFLLEEGGIGASALKVTELATMKNCTFW